MTDAVSSKWSMEQLQKELLNAEKSDRFTYEELTPLWDKAKETIENEEQAVSLYTTYIYMTRRFISKQGLNDYARVDELFREAIDLLVKLDEECSSDASIQMKKNYAYFLYTKMRKPDEAHAIWDELLIYETGPWAWLEAILLERAYGDVEHARRLFYKSLDVVTFRPHDIFSAFVQFEREDGTREDLDRCLERINAKVTELNVDGTQQQNSRRKKFPQQSNKAIKQQPPKKRKAEEPVSLSPVSISIPSSSSTSNSFPYATGLEKNKLFVKHLHFGCKETELKEFFGSYGKIIGLRIVTKWNGKSKGCAYIDFATNEEAAAAVMGADGATIHGKKIEVYFSNPPPKQSETKNIRTNSSMNSFGRKPRINL